MGLYNFKARFVPFVLSGEKKHTIRATRKHTDKPGDICHLYTGLRTKNAKLLLRAPCVKVEEIEIRSVCSCPAVDDCDCSLTVFIDGVELDKSEREGLAKKDGFVSFADMAAFWKGRLPFAGQIIHWA